MSLARLAGLGFALVAAGIGISAWLMWTPDLPRSELEAKYLEQPGDLMEVDGVRLHVRDRGPRDAPIVVMIHGTASHLQSWDDWAAGLEGSFRVVRLDLPGHGLSSPDPTGDYSDERTIALLAALMDQLGLAKASIIGSSLGGRIAWKFAAAHPDRTAKLVLVSPDGFASPGFEYGKAPEVPASLSLMKHFLPKRLLRPQLAAAYAAVVNRGIYVRPYFIERVQSRNGRTLQEHMPQAHQAMDPRHAYVLAGPTGARRGSVRAGTS